MATTLNASTSSGLIAFPDTSGILQLQSNGTTIMTISSTGVSTQVGAPAFSAYLPTANQSVTTNTWTKVSLSAEEFDTNNNFDSTTNYRFTPTIAGYYQINGAIFCNGTANTQTTATCAIYKNGTNYKNGAYWLSNSASASGILQVVSAVVYFNGSTDYVELWGLNVQTSPYFGFGSANTYFNGAMVRSA